MNSYSKINELQRLGDLVQRRLLYLQNPKNCSATKKILCTFKRKDLSNVNHIQIVQLPRFFQLVKRPNYYPLAAPEDIADEITQVHKNPSSWWTGQFLVYITRQNHLLQRCIEQFIAASGFRRPIVGVQVRRTDKSTVTRNHKLEEYMSHVDAWYDNYEKRHHVVKRRVYLASDDIDVLTQAKKSYPNYTFVTNTNASALARNKTTRYSESSLLGLVIDIHLLSMCDFFVCTLSSNVGRLVYQLMHVRYWDAPDRIKSLDNEYSFSGRFVQKKSVVNNRIKIVSGDLTVVKDTSKNPLKPMVSNDNRKGRVKMPTYPEVPRG